MKKIIIPLTILTVFNSTAQEAKPTDRKMIFKLETGLVTYKRLQLSDDTWNKAIPDSDFAAPDSLDTYRYKSYGHNLGFTTSVNTISLDFTYKNSFLASKNIQSSLGFILGYGGGSYIQDSYERRTSTPYDILVSQQTGTQYPFVKTSYETYSRRYISKDVLIGIGNHYATNPDKIVSFSTGIELVYTFSVSQQMYKSYINEVVIEQAGTSNEYDYYNQSGGLHDPNNLNEDLSGPTQYKEAKGPMMHSFYGRIPLEVSFKLGAKPRWCKSRIGVSLTPSISYSVVNKNSGVQYCNWVGLNYRLTI